MNNPVQARRAVLVSMFLLALLTLYRDRQKTRDQGPAGAYRVFWGVGVVGMFLSLLADFVPQIAGPFAGLIVLGSFTHGGEQALEKALGVIAPQPSTTSSSPPPGPSSSPLSATQGLGPHHAPANP